MHLELSLITHCVGLHENSIKSMKFEGIFYCTSCRYLNQLARRRNRRPHYSNSPPSDVFLLAALVWCIASRSFGWVSGLSRISLAASNPFPSDRPKDRGRAGRAGLGSRYPTIIIMHCLCVFSRLCAQLLWDRALTGSRRRSISHKRCNHRTRVLTRVLLM